MSRHARHRKTLDHPTGGTPVRTTGGTTDRTTVRRRLRMALAPAVVLAFTVAVTGCSVADIPGVPGASGAPGPVRVADTTPTPSTGTASPAAAASTTPTVPAATTPFPAPSAPPSWVRTSADLDHGSVHHVLDAAAHKLIIDYWSTTDPASWTPASTPIIRLNAHIDGPPDGNTIKVTRFNARADALGAVLANDQGDFALAPPYSYSSGVVVPANPKAHGTQVLFTFDLLTETAPGSGIYARQTILDTVSIGYAKPVPDTNGSN